MPKILITGSNGQLGLEITKQLQENNNHNLLLVDLPELDITNLNVVNKFVKNEKPDIIINCAAYTQVDDCETNIDTAYKANALGARNLAIASNDIKSKIIHISTDYVFNGQGIVNDDGNRRPYNEFDITNPQSVYGKTKLEGENFVKSMNPKHFIIRPAWLYGEGNNFVRTMLRLSEKMDTLKVVNDQQGSPTSTNELSRAIINLMNTDNYGVFHGTCEDDCTWYDFAKEIFKLAGKKTNVLPCTTEEFPRPAKRPAYSVLDNYMLRLTMDYKFNTWQEEIEKYIKEI